MTLRFVIPIAVKNPLNGSQGRTRGAMIGKAQKRKKEREAAHYCFIAAGGRDFVPDRILKPVVTLTRVAPRAFDTDGLAASLKSIRDQLAVELGVSDAPSSGAVWSYAQRRGGVREHLVEVTIE